jgi:serine/threonine protein kinase
MNQEQIKIIRDLLRELKSIIKRYDADTEDVRNAFYLPEDVQKLWVDKRKIITLLGLQKSSEFVEPTYSQMTGILTTLVTINAKDCLQNFTSLFFGTKAQPQLTDDALPLSKDDIYWFQNEPAMLDLFFSKQFMFAPYRFSVTDDKELTTILPQCRLPFEEDPKFIASGGYGEVSVAKICPSYFRENDTVNFQSKLVAIKKIKQGEFFQIEARNLRVLKKSIRSARAIQQHFAIIKHGTEEFVMMPFAKLGDLWHFLRGGKGPLLGQQYYNFAQEFPKVTDQNLPLQLINQCWCIADALKWLHCDIQVEDTGLVRLAHQDLKPDNILIDAPQNSDQLVGSWKISDFGCSVIDQNSDLVTVGDIIDGLKKPQKIGGPYSAPEKSIGVEGDVWSFGCVVSEVLAFAIGREQEVQSYIRKRITRGSGNGDKPNDKFFIERPQRRTSWFLGDPGSQPRNVYDYVVKPEILHWLESVSEHDRTEFRWANCWVQTISNMLVVNPKTRPSSTKVFEFIAHIKDHMRNPAVAKTCMEQELCPVTLAVPPLPVPTLDMASVQDSQSSRISRISRPVNSRITPFSILPSRRPSGASDDDDNSIISSPPPSIFARLSTTETVASRPDSLLRSERLNSASDITGSTVSANRTRSAASQGGVPPNSHGILHQPSKPRVRSNHSKTDFNGKVTAIAVSEHQSMAIIALLSNDTVYTFKVTNETLHMIGLPINLQPTGEGWTNVSLAGKYMACWGYKANVGKLVSVSL